MWQHLRSKGCEGDDVHKHEIHPRDVDANVQGGHPQLGWEVPRPGLTRGGVNAVTPGDLEKPETI